MYKSSLAYKSWGANDDSSVGRFRALVVLWVSVARLLANSVGECFLIYEGILRRTALTNDIWLYYMLSARILLCITNAVYSVLRLPFLTSSCHHPSWISLSFSHCQNSSGCVCPFRLHLGNLFIKQDSDATLSRKVVSLSENRRWSITAFV